MPMLDVMELREMPTLCVGQAANLKINTGTMRVWVSRCRIADGETQPVQVERLIDGRWEDITGDRMDHICLDGEYSGMYVQVITRRL